MRTTKKGAFVKGRRLRVTRLDACGRPVYGDDAVVVSKGFISVAFTANTTETDEIRVTNANGETLAYEASVQELAGYGLELVFGEVDPELFSLVTGQEVVLDADGNPVGIDVDTKVNLNGQGFALEVWAGVPSGDACSDEQAEGSYGYLLVPFLQGGILGDFTVENGGINFTITGANTKDGNAWGKGPHNDVQLNGPAGSRVAGPLVEAVKPTVALRSMFTQVAPPEPTIGSRPLLDPTAPAITSVSATGSGMTRALAVVPDVGADDGVWYEFGDDTWDYVLGGDASHTYATPGTYTVTANSNGVLRSTTVTVAA